MRKDRLLQLAFLAVAAATLTGAALLRRPLQQRHEKLAPSSVASDKDNAATPYADVLQLAPGGLRAVALNYLWIRSQQLKDDGRFYDAKQVRELICLLMRYHPGAWNFLSWDMAWNISVATHTPQERWTWVHNGITLIRDRGLIYNPDDLLLHKQLAWIFFAKMGEYTDEMHMVYKRRWAEQMDHVLGSPPLASTTEDVIAAFRPVADAPDRLEQLLADAEVAKYVGRLSAAGVTADERFIRFYNLYSKDPLRGQLITPDQQPSQDTRSRIAELMTDPELAEARAKVLAFARRKVLIEQYRMDPKWMLALMIKYGPLDWRSVHPHAIYWATMGLYRSAGVELEQLHPGSAEAMLREQAAPKLDLARMNMLNTERIVLIALRALTHVGQLYYSYRPNPANPAEPIIDIDWAPDWRFIEPVHREYAFAGAALTGDPDRLDAQTNTLRDAHIIFLTDAVQELYFGGRDRLAQEYYDKIKTLLKPTDPVFQLDLDQFVWEKYRTDPTPTFNVARAFWFGAMARMYKALASGNNAEYLQARNFAQSVYKRFAESIGRASRFQAALQPFAIQERNFLISLLLRPRTVGLEVPVVTKSLIYRSVPHSLQAGAYPFVAEQMQAECRQEGLDFDKAFPPPEPARQIQR